MGNENHESFLVNDVGLIIRWTQLAASPDRLVFCECCDGGCLEVVSIWTKNQQNTYKWLFIDEKCLTKGSDQIINKKPYILISSKSANFC